MNKILDISSVRMAAIFKNYPQIFWNKSNVTVKINVQLGVHCQKDLMGYREPADLLPKFDLFVYPVQEDKEKWGNTLNVLNKNYYDWDLIPQGALGRLTMMCGSIDHKKAWYIKELQSPFFYFRLNNSLKKMYKPWKLNILKYIEEIALKNDIKMMIGSTPEVTHRLSGHNVTKNVLREFYESPFIRQGYSKKLVEFIHTDGLKTEKDTFWVKELQ